jgi:hypothetical protein
VNLIDSLLERPIHLNRRQRLLTKLYRALHTIDEMQNPRRHYVTAYFWWSFAVQDGLLNREATSTRYSGAQALQSYYGYAIGYALRARLAGS